MGNLEAKRDFTDVRDIVQAYWLSLEKCEAGEAYNIGTGKFYSMSNVVEMLVSMSDVEIETQIDPTRLRPSDVPILLSDSSDPCMSQLLINYIQTGIDAYYNRELKIENSGSSS